MASIVDTAAVVSLYDAADPDHARVRAWFAAVDEDLVTTPAVLAEIDRLIGARGGAKARDVLWSDLSNGAFAVRWWADALRETIEIARRHPFLGLADASLVALSGVLRTNRIATFNEHFRSVTTPSGEGFVLLPDDA